jgi:hypothetical protein
MKRLAFTLLLGTALASSQCLGGVFFRSCSNCGCKDLNRTCKVVPDKKKVTETKYVVECEEVCLPGRSQCEERLVTDPVCVDQQRYEKVMVPTCERIITKKKLKKITTTVEKPGWKCVVETVRQSMRHVELQSVIRNPANPGHDQHQSATMAISGDFAILESG